MRKARGRVILPAIGVAILVVFIGAKMASRGWISLDRIKSKAHAQQPAPLVWPPALAPENDDFCHTVKLNLAQVDKAQEEGINIDQQRRCITRAAMAEHEVAKVRHAAARKQHESQHAEQVQIEQLVDQQIASGEIALQSLMQARAGKTTQIATAL